MNAHAGSPILDAAQSYAAKGWPVFPCRLDKKPATFKGFKDATTDIASIELAFSRADRMIGVPPAAIGCWVLDVDKQHDGDLTLLDLEAKYGNLPRTVTTNTPSLGRHYWFKMPEGSRKPTTSKGHLRRLGPGLDVRGEGGYVIVPPSARDDGMSYFWEVSPDQMEPAEAPQWLLDLVVPPEVEPEPPAPAAPAAPLPDCSSDGSRERAYVLAALDGECRALASAPVGDRNNQANRSAFAIGQLIGPHLSEGEAYSALERAAMVCGIPANDRAMGPRGTIARGLRDGQQSPREIPAGQTYQPAALPRHDPVTGEILEEFWGTVRNLGADLEYNPPDELVRDTLPLIGTGFIGGQSGALKTFAAIELSFCIMTGEPFAGRKVEQPGGVLYIAFEGRGTIHGRMMARRSKLADPNQRLPFYVVDGLTQIHDPRDWQNLAKLVAHTSEQCQAGYGVPLRAVIIDTVAAASMIKEDRENDAASWTAIFNGANPIAAENKLLIAMVHHFGKSADAGLRGSSAARAGADFVLALTCKRDETTGQTSDHAIALSKTRDGTEGPIATITKEVVEIGARRDGSSISSLVLQFNTNEVIASKFALGTRKPTAAQRTLAEALNAALVDHGQSVHVLGERSSPKVLAVKYERLKEAFEKRSISGGHDDPKKRADAIRKNLSNAMKRSTETVCSGTWDGAEWVWKIEPQRLNARDEE